MRKLLFVSALMTLLSAHAYAAGCDLTVVACPGGEGASNDAGTLDCAGGETVTLLASFQPAEDIADFAAVDGILTLRAAGEVNEAATFWDLEVANASVLSGTQRRPATGCADYTNPYLPPGSGFAVGAAVRGPRMVRIACTAYRAGTLAVKAGQKIFAFQLTLDASTSAESSGGNLTGCTQPVSITLDSLTPGSLSNAPTTVLKSGSQMLNSVVFNGGQLPAIAPPDSLRK